MVLPVKEKSVKSLESFRPWMLIEHKSRYNSGANGKSLLNINSSVLNSRKHSFVTFKENDIPKSFKPMTNGILVDGGNCPVDSIGWVSGGKGDFNAILSPSEKKGGCSNDRRFPFFGDFIESAELNDVGFRGSPFMWYKGGVFECLDRAMGNDVWVAPFPNCAVTHLSRLKYCLLGFVFALLRDGPFAFLVDHLKSWSRDVYGYTELHKKINSETHQHSKGSISFSLRLLIIARNGNSRGIG
ncbi:hypothetical protein PVK06_039623 [Gossypium arboreum]|uniref:Uncharacterized protein n=1 Tax=Gossypium arboreum TaxID=29729 RepID=A0ABR0N3D2_GOSAR|nr:hypothetical protein PVK06_039623 [Gossypium arboreum]